MPIVCISGGFDPLHVGHVRLIHDAALIGDVVVILNSDAWLERKKGYVFMDWVSRAEIILNHKGVKSVEPVNDDDGTVIEALARIRPDYFANGGDRTGENTAELVYCLDYGIKPLFGVGGDKVASSQEIAKEAREYYNRRSGIGCTSFPQSEWFVSLLPNIGWVHD